MREAQRVFDELELGILPDDALVPTLRDVRGLLDRVGGPHLSASMAFLLSQLALKTLLTRKFPVAAARIAATHTAGMNGLETVLPAVEIRAARDDHAGRDAILGGEVRGVRDLPVGPTRRALQRFLVDHGHRGAREAELSLPRVDEDPRPVLLAIAAAIRGGADHETALSRARAMVDRELADVEARLSFFELEIARALIDRARKFLRVRERLRLLFSRVLAMLRKLALEIDRRLLRVDRSLSPGSVFLCSSEELSQALGTGRPDVTAVVGMRAEEHARDLARTDPPLTFVGAAAAFPPLPRGSSLLRGVPSSTGRARGKVRVVRAGAPEGNVFHPGEVLVAHSADVSLAPLLLVAGGLVTELGGPLSSGALAARELAVPAVGYVAGARLALATGDDVVVDGEAGTVELLEPT
jgi:rifampicin phosphotransferase